ncbi:glycosyltransferase involved in cell wall biosynthesis [Bacillus sp. SORGH_AS 510]|uniref:glycosyltransferase family 4 protein n=1 Tax=Bacillus sp. SORGH_AS_0510 TaxID=3041771 RepID=UPI0027859574|nr:glycosyltransferase family 4 protein [Bacillus sp. SORGH_AS_0510]MDQ1144164.1 glycosyltransferase involved in cell wall biosynthesis [Bacillus sp. SORGH_AS_0510]
MKRILFYESRPEWGGAQKCELELLNALENNALQTYFLTSTDGPMNHRVSAHGKSVFLIPISRHIDNIRKGQVRTGLFFLLIQVFYLLPHFIKVMFFILRNRIDIIYTSQFRSQLVIGWLAKLLGRKVIWHIHGEEKIDNLLGRICITTADKIIVVSQLLNDRYCTLYPNKIDKFITVHNGVDSPSLSNTHIKNSEFTISMVGTLIEGKRQDLAILAVAELIKMGYNVQLKIIGEKPPWLKEDYFLSLQRLVHQLGLANSVLFLGWLDQPWKALLQSNVFILPSDTEGLPLSIIEAMAIGLPVISTNVGGVPELIEDGKTGFIIPPGNVEELVRKLKKLIESPSACEQMGKEALKRYETRFTKELFVKGVAGVIHTVIQ